MNSIFIISCILLKGVSIFALEIPVNDLSPIVSNYATLESVPIRYCYCGNNQVWNSGKCIFNETLVNFIHFNPWTSVPIKSQALKNGIVNDLICNSTETLVVLKNEFAITEENYLFDIFSGNIFDEYCLRHVIDNENNIVTEAAVCLPPLEIPSCCSSNQVIDRESLRCSENKSLLRKSLNPPVRIGKQLMNDPDLKSSENPIPKCQRKLFSILNVRDDLVTLEYQYGNFLLFDNQNLLDPTVRFPSNYCIGREFLTASASKFIAVTWNETEINNNCGTDQCNQIMYWLLLPLLIISTVFLFIILIIHIVMEELRKTIGGKITLCHVTSLFIAFCILLALHVPQDFNCKIYGPLVQTSFLAAFFWLNVMCFDLWWKLRCRNPARESKETTQKKFLHYSIYAWGCPLLIGVVTIIMDNVSFPDHLSWIIKPGFGEKHCWFAERSATMLYYFGIIGLLMLVNTVFFIWVCAILIKANCTYRSVLKNNRKSSDRSWIYLRVFSVMGVTWICEFFSWSEGTCIYWAITDIINSLRGIILFFIFFGNRKSMNKIRERFVALNATVHTTVTDSLKKISLKTSFTSDGGTDSRRTSSTTTELPNKIQTSETVENG